MHNDTLMQIAKGGEELKGILTEAETTEKPKVSIEELIDLIKGYGGEA